jgi:hypothetical protein
MLVTSGPESGKTTSVLSAVVQPFPIFATKRDGREEKDTSALFLLVAPVMVTDAQFIYISLLPTLLNHVHANMAAPVFASEGITKSKLGERGQPPM